MKKEEEDTVSVCPLPCRRGRGSVSHSGRYADEAVEPVYVYVEATESSSPLRLERTEETGSSIAVGYRGVDVELDACV